MPDSTFDPIRRRLIGAAAATFLLSVSKLGFAGNSQVVAIRIWPASSYTRITLEASDAIKFKQFTISNPDRLVIDLEGVQLNSVLKDISSQIADADPTSRPPAPASSARTPSAWCWNSNRCQTTGFHAQPGGRVQTPPGHRPLPSSGAQDDPLMALLDDYNKGKLTEPPPQVKPKKNDSNRPIVVMLDPGHGGEDPGAIGMNGTREKDIVLRIGKQLKRMIDAERNMKAFMTRDEDIFIPLGVRVAKARKLNADLFISIHADAAPNRSARGSSVFALSGKALPAFLPRPWRNRKTART
jgi:N-acetylmuramoyl-L-alanine amidase